MNDNYDVHGVLDMTMCKYNLIITSRDSCHKFGDVLMTPGNDYVEFLHVITMAQYLSFLTAICHITH